MKRAIVFVILLWALAITVNACASTRQDAVKASWYLKGEGDDALGPMGLVITDLTCRPTRSKYVACQLRTVTPDYGKALCSTGKFYLKNYAVSGQWSKPRACPPSS